MTDTDTDTDTDDTTNGTGPRQGRVPDLNLILEGIQDQLDDLTRAVEAQQRTIAELQHRLLTNG